jgi:porin
MHLRSNRSFHESTLSVGWTHIAIVLIASLYCCGPVSAETTEVQHESGYEDVSDIGEGPSDITDAVEMDDRTKEALAGPPTTLVGNWYDAKEKLQQKTGIQFGINWTGLYQVATESLDDENQAAGGRFQIEGTWTALGRGTENSGILGFRFQDRHRLGTELSPFALGSAIGSVWTTGHGFNEFDFSLTDFWWEQNMLKGMFSIRLGKYLPFNIYDPFSFKSPLTGFQNAAFNGTPAIAFPSFGLGAVGKIRLSDAFDFLIGLNDANGSPTTSGFDTFFEDQEYFVAGEIRWHPSFESGSGKFNLTAWHTDEREQISRPSGWGTTAAGEYAIGRVTPFLRFSWSDGDATTLKQLLAGGITVHDILENENDLIGVGFSWGRPSDDLLEDQSAVEIFYRIHVLQTMALTPSVQAVIDPALNPDENLIFVFGARLRLAF